MKKLYIAIIILTASITSFAQIKVGADIYSRYLWRGIDFGDAPAFQPSLSYTSGSFTVGAWGSYAFPTAGPTYAENDLWASYAISTEASGSFSAIVTDYYVPSAGIPFGHFKHKVEQDGTPKFAAHTIEGGLTYSGPEKFPISLALYANLSNDPDNSTYIQVGYPVAVSEATVTFAAGFVPSKSAYYLVDKGNIINLSITASKTISVTDKFSFPINVSYISNPSQDKTYLVFGASFVF
ncbi:MAG: hypothetical protein HYZ10_04250 [Ignavibacteriales bacterium]|nr:hypothetical protein [Ignavibacteriales bacterium]